MQLLLRLQRALPFLVVIGVGLYFWHLAGQFDFVARGNRVGPDIWPRIVLGLMLLAAAVGALQALLRQPSEADLGVFVRLATRAAGKEKEASRDLAGDGDAATKRPVFAMLAIAIIAAFVAAAPYVGFTIATFVLLLTLMLIGGYTRPLRATMIALLGTLAFLVVFQRIVYVSLPLGAGQFKELSVALLALIGVR